MKKILLIPLVIAISFSNSSAKIHSWKGAVHVSVAPLIAGTGIYSSVTTLQQTDKNATRAAAITDLSFLGLQAAGGLTLLFSNDNLPPVFRTIHKIIGIGVISSGLWLSIAGSLDNQISNGTRYTAYGHTILAAAPILLFSF